MPNLNWTSEIMPIKQSACVTIALFRGFGYTSLLCVGFRLLNGCKIGFVGYFCISCSSKRAVFRNDKEGEFLIMEHVFDFLRAALPWIAMGLLLAVFFARSTRKKSRAMIMEQRACVWGCALAQPLAPPLEIIPASASPWVC